MVNASRWSSDQWPIESDLLTDDFEDLLAMKAEPVPNRYERFCTLLSDNPELVEQIKTDAGMTLFSPVTQAQQSFKDHLLKIHSQQNAPKKNFVQKPKLIIEKDENQLGLIEERLSQPVKKAELSGALAANMMRVASDELNRMHKGFPTQYNELRTQYFSSLNDEDRTVILEMRKLMQLNSFEDQLRKRLVKYMVKNPGSWRMADPSAQFLKDTKSLRIH